MTTTEGEEVKEEKVEDATATADAATKEGEEEPPAKKQKTGWEDHTMNISEAVMKADEGRHLADIAGDTIDKLQGIGPHSKEVLETMGLSTINDLATYKFFKMARSLKTLSETETEKGRVEGSVMNVDKAVDKEYETKTLCEIVDAPVSSLEGLTEAADEQLKKLGVKTVGDLADLKYCRWAEAICDVSKYENQLTSAERKKERELKKLA